MKSCRTTFKRAALAASVLTAGLASSSALAYDSWTGPGAIFTASNAAGANAVQVYDRAPSGQLSFAGSVPTGGLGTGAGLGNQGGVVLSADLNLLLVVNAGSNDVSLFGVWGDKLKLLSRVASGGKTPTSVTVDDDLVYVLNAGSDSIAGFRIGEGGQLRPLAGSVRPLSGTGVGAAQIQFSPGGHDLVVTEKATNRITVYPIGDDGLPAAQPVVTASNGQTPYGFGFARDRSLVVSNAAGGAPNGASVSSYHVARAGTVSVVSAAVPDQQTAACWIAVTPDRRFAYTTNTASSTISGYQVAEGGALTLLASGPVSTGANSGPLDEAVAGGGRFLYTLNEGSHAVASFMIRSDGSLVAGPVVSGLPATANGLAGY